MDKALLSTGKDDWGTPQKLYDALNKEFGERYQPAAGVIQQYNYYYGRTLPELQGGGNGRKNNREN